MGGNRNSMIGAVGNSIAKATRIPVTAPEAPITKAEPNIRANPASRSAPKIPAPK